MKLRSYLLFAASGVASTANFFAAPALADVTISTDTTQNMSCAAGVCRPTATDAVLNVNDLEGYLASGDVELTTAGSGVDAQNIDVETGLTWSNSSTLSLVATQAIKVDQPVSVTGLGGLSITDDGQNEDFSFGSSGNVTFSSLSSSLSINGVAFTLENTVKELASAIAANPSGDFALAANYSAKRDGTYGTVPIETLFRGVLEGLGNSITHLNFGGSASGLVGTVDTTGEVRDLILAHFKANAGRAGFGALTPDNAGSIVQCGVSGSIVASSNKSSYFGGLVVANNGGTVSDSWAAVKITAQRGDLVGGLVAINSGTVERSWATGGITLKTKKDNGLELLGGLVGENDPGNVIVDSYAEVSVTGEGAGYATKTGGLEADNQGTVSTSYSTGALVNVGGNVGGLIGYDEAVDSLTDTYWDITTSGITNLSQGAGYPSNDPGITGLTTVQFQSGLPSGFDSSVWTENSSVNDGLPYLIANPPKK